MTLKRQRVTILEHNVSRDFSCLTSTAVDYPNANRCSRGSAPRGPVNHSKVLHSQQRGEHGRRGGLRSALLRGSRSCGADVEQEINDDKEGPTLSHNAPSHYTAYGAAVLDTTLSNICARCCVYRTQPAHSFAAFSPVPSYTASASRNCSAWSLEYSPPRPRSSSCVPCSTIRPPLITTRRSASRTVESL